MNYCRFREDHIDDALDLWAQTEWSSVSDADKPEALLCFLNRNSGCSWVAESDGDLVGTVLAGHDARRGYIYHLVVEETARGRGIGKALLDKALDSLREAGILKCHAIVIDGNPAADFFWTHHGWQAQETTQFSKFLN